MQAVHPFFCDSLYTHNICLFGCMGMCNCSS